ncbi:MAG: VWA domain-containing protein [bacterium]|nr:VWA domain-containing protein [bacterium]
MSYAAEISRTNPSCFVFLIDQSGSMADRCGAGESKRSKAQGIADAINKLLQNLVIKCAKSDGIRDYYHVAVIGYGAQVGSAFTGPLSGRDLVPISEIADRPARIEERRKKADDGAGGLIEESVKFPVWFDPAASGGTPMCEALARAQALLAAWLNEHPSCFPPVVIHLTDGEATDGDPTVPAEALRALASNDGEVLLFNGHVSSHRASPIEFPDAEDTLPDEYARLLFRMSSFLPDHIRAFAQQEGYNVSPNTRGFTFNADFVAVIRFLDIGTRPANLR